MGSSKKTIAALQIVGLLEPGIAEAEGRRQAIMRSGGDMAMYAAAYTAFKKGYRKKVSPTFLNSIGYNPYTAAQTRVLDTFAVKNYLASKSIDVGSIITLRGTYLDMYSTMENHLQNNYVFVNSTETLTIGGKIYKSLHVTNTAGTLNLSMAQLYTEAITNRLNTYGYDGTYIWRNSEKYVVGNISPVVYDVLGIPNYSVTTTKVDSPNTAVTEYVPIVYFTLAIPEIAYEVMYVTYSLISGGVNEWFSYIENLDTIPNNLYVLDTINMTAILPLKENNTVYDLKEKRRKQLLRRIGIEPKDMVESLENPDLDNAYIWTGLPIGNTDETSIKVMFKTFDYIASGSGNISVSMSQLSMNYSFTISKTTHAGTIGAVGSYTKSLIGEDIPKAEDVSGGYFGESSTLTLQFQGSSSEYRQIVITNYVNTYTVSGYVFMTYLTSTKETTRLIIPLDVLNELKYREYVQVFESSLSMICYSIAVVKIKWYQTGLFKILLLIVMIIIAIYTGYFDPETFAATMSTMTITEMVTTMITSIAISVGISTILKTLGPELGALVTIIAIVVLAACGYMNMNFDNFNGYLVTATNVLQTMDQAIAMKVNEIMAKGRQELEEIASKSEEVQKLMEGMRSLEGGMTYMIGEFNDTAVYNTTPTVDSYFANMLGGTAFNFDVMYDVDGAITKRKVVNSG